MGNSWGLTYIMKWRETISIAWIHTCSAPEEFFYDVQAFMIYSIVKWRKTIMVAIFIILSSCILVCTPIQKFFNDIQASQLSSKVKWCSTILISCIHRYSLVQKFLDAIQFSS